MLSCHPVTLPVQLRLRRVEMVGKCGRPVSVARPQSLVITCKCQ